MRHPVTIRTATPADLDAIGHVEAACFGAHALPPIALRQFLDLGGPRCLVATQDRAVTAHALAAVDHAGHGWLLGLAVHPQARRQGLGGRLTRAVVDAFARDDVRPVFLTVDPDNAGARALYARCGFHDDTLVPDCFGPGENRLRMRWG